MSDPPETYAAQIARIVVAHERECVWTRQDEWTIRREMERRLAAYQARVAATKRPAA